MQKRLKVCAAELWGLGNDYPSLVLLKGRLDSVLSTSALYLSGVAVRKNED